ncbi:ash family protein [Leclercia adecarboxylata]|uniref:ash family protein n=1 Tax=Leclercia adecarboxylata TaxID=83655 RepID=UPI00215DA43F
MSREVMVGWMGAEQSAPVTLYAGYANPVQLTTSEIGVSGGGIYSQYKEAAKCWLLPPPKSTIHMDYRRSSPRLSDNQACSPPCYC